MFEPLRDLEYFARVSVDGELGTVVREALWEGAVVPEGPKPPTGAVTPVVRRRPSAR